MLEVANCEYGNFNPQLAKAAVDDRWRLSSSYITSGEPIRPIEQFQLEPMKNVATRMDSNESREIYRVPSEWTKFWVLVGRCHIHLYRDWVRII